MSDAVARLNAALEGRYEIERELGEGGMATVYLAKDLKHNRNVAVKVLKPELAAVVGADRFLAEIETTANLQHPHILPLFDSGQAGSILFYVMPYIEGESLRERLERERQLPVDEAVRIATDVAEALHSAHAQGVIHRDIKPANILLSKGRPLVADFGIALAVAQAGGGRLTETGLSMGTPFYMSPEQASADREPTPASDVYSLGCVLYEMLVGEPPYTGGSAQAVLAKILMGEAPSATAARTSIPANVDAAIRKALERLPADRWTGVEQFAKALTEPAFRHREGVAPGLAGRTGRWTPLALGLGALVAFAVGFGWSLMRPTPPRPVTRQVLSTEGWAGLDTEFGRYAALAPDGSSMILPLDDRLGLKLRGSTEITPIAGTEGARDVVYSPDGQWIAYAVDAELHKRPLAGGSALRLAEDTEVAPNRVGMTWLDDGTILYESTGGILKQIPEEGGEPLVVLDADIGQFWWVEGLPEARGVLVINVLNQLHAVDLPGGSSRLVLEDAVRAWYAPTGHIVYVRTDGAVFAVPFDLDGLATTGGAIPLFDGVRTVINRVDMRLAADGTMLYVEGPALAISGDRLQLFVVDLEGNEEAVVLAPRQISSVGWSPDGQSVVYSSDQQIYTYNVSLGTTPRQLTFEGNNQNPVFSPDGTRVAFNSFAVGTDGSDLFVKSLDDDSPPRSIITLEANQLVTQWPSDSLIVFERAEANNRDLWTVDLSDPENPRAAAYLSSEADLRYMVVSPDGTLAAYTSNESGQFEIYIRSFPEPGGLTIVSEGGGNVPFWSPDGAILYYSSLSQIGMFAARIERDPVPVVVARTFLFRNLLPVRPFQGTGLHPDGDRFIFARFGGTSTESVPRPERLILVQNFFEELRRLGPN